MSQSLNKLYAIDTRYHYRYFWFTCGCLLLFMIIYASLASGIPIPQKNHVDKALHTLSYLTLMLWWLQLYPRLAMRLLLSLGFISMGAGIEVLQSYNPLRYFDVADMIANSIGVMIGLFAGMLGAGDWLLKIEQRLLLIRERLSTRH